MEVACIEVEEASRRGRPPRCTGTYQSALVGEFTIAAHERVSCDCLPKDFHAQHVCDDVLGFPVNVRVHQRHVVVGHDAVAESRQALLDALHHDAVGQRIPQVQQLPIRARARHQQPLAVPHRHAAHEAAAGNGSVHHGDVVRQLLLKHAVKVLAAPNGHQRIAVGEVGKHAHLVAVLKLRAARHVASPWLGGAGSRESAGGCFDLSCYETCTTAQTVAT